MDVFINVNKMLTLDTTLHINHLFQCSNTGSCHDDYFEQ